MNIVVFSSATEEWATPRAFVQAIETEFGVPFDLDVCATPENAVCPRFYTKADDGLARSWDADLVWMNPPYGHGIGKWTQRAADAVYDGDTTRAVVGLIPAKTETSWWHRDVMAAAEIRFIRGRMRFSGSPINAPFPSALVIWRRGFEGFPRFTTMDRIL